MEEDEPSIAVLLSQEEDEIECEERPTDNSLLLKESFFSSLYLIATIFYLLLAGTIVLMSFKKLYKLIPVSILYNLFVSQSALFFTGIFITNLSSISLLFLFSSYVSFLIYFLLFLIFILFVFNSWLISLYVPTYLTILSVFILAAWVFYKYNLLKSIPQAIKVGNLSILVAKKNRAQLGLIFLLCQIISMIFSGIWVVLLSHALLIGYHNFQEINTTSFTIVSFFITLFLFFYYFWSSFQIGNFQKMLTFFVIHNWWRVHSSSLSLRECTENHLDHVDGVPTSSDGREGGLSEEFLLNLTDWIFWIWNFAFSQLSYASFVMAYFTLLNFTLSVLVRLLGLLWVPVWITAPFTLFLRFIKLKQSRILPLALVNVIEQPGVVTSISIEESRSQLDRILSQQQVYAVAPNLLHFIFNLLSILLSILVVLVSIYCSNLTSISLSSIAIIIISYSVIGTSINRSFFRIIIDVADCILVCHIRSVDGQVLLA